MELLKQTTAQQRGTEGATTMTTKKAAATQAAIAAYASTMADGRDPYSAEREARQAAREAGSRQIGADVQIASAHYQQHTDERTKLVHHITRCRYLLDIAQQYRYRSIEDQAALDRAEAALAAYDRASAEGQASDEQPSSDEQAEAYTPSAQAATEPTEAEAATEPAATEYDFERQHYAGWLYTYANPNNLPPAESPDSLPSDEPEQPTEAEAASDEPEQTSSISACTLRAYQEARAAGATIAAAFVAARDIARDLGLTAPQAVRAAHHAATEWQRLQLAEIRNALQETLTMIDINEEEIEALERCTHPEREAALEAHQQQLAELKEIAADQIRELSLLASWTRQPQEERTAPHGTTYAQIAEFVYASQRYHGAARGVAWAAARDAQRAQGCSLAKACYNASRAEERYTTTPRRPNEQAAQLETEIITAALNAYTSARQLGDDHATAHKRAYYAAAAQYGATTPDCLIAANAAARHYARVQAESNEDLRLERQAEESAMNTAVERARAYGADYAASVAEARALVDDEAQPGAIRDAARQALLATYDATSEQPTVLQQRTEMQAYIYLDRLRSEHGERQQAQPEAR